jgi:ribosomal protein S18 acetylase RimI-like enzyme
MWAGPWLPYPLDPELLPADIDLYGADSVAMVEDDRLVAFGQLMHVDAKRAHLARIIVAPAERGRGRGRVLIGELVRRALVQDYACISLYVNRGNPAALALYRRFGFRRAPRPPGEQASSNSLYMLYHPDRDPPES